MEVSPYKDRETQVRETRKLLKLNQRIKAAVTINRIEKSSLVSQKLKTKLLSTKVERAKQMRLRYPKPPEMQSLTLDVPSHCRRELSQMRIGAPRLKQGLNKEQSFQARSFHPGEIMRKMNETLALKELEHDFDSLLEQTIIKYDPVSLVKADKQELAKQISQNIKKQLLDKYIIGETRELNLAQNPPRVSPPPTSSPSGARHARQSEVPYALQSRSKEGERRYSSISKSFEHKLFSIHSSLRLDEQERRMREKCFIGRIKNPKYYYQMISDIKVPFQSL